MGTRPPAAVRKRWTRGEYEQLAKLGIFHPDERLELIEGEIFELTPQGSGHATAVVLTSEAIRERLEPDYIVRVQLPLALDDFSEPEPDIAVVPGAARDYRDAHPTMAALVIEIADTTLDYDRHTKAPLYARAGIPEYWIVNLADRQLEVYRNPGPLAESPGGFGYRLRLVLSPGEEAVAPGTTRAMKVDELLP